MKILIIGTADRRSTIPQGVSYLCKNITVQSLEEITKYIFFIVLRKAYPGANFRSGLSFLYGSVLVIAGIFCQRFSTDC